MPDTLIVDEAGRRQGNFRVPPDFRVKTLMERRASPPARRAGRPFLHRNLNPHRSACQERRGPLLDRGWFYFVIVKCPRRFCCQQVSLDSVQNGFSLP
jgi:hypothetical protein